MQRTDVAPQADQHEIGIPSDTTTPSRPCGIDTPRWLRVLAFGTAAGFLAFGSSGLLLLVLGLYTASGAFAVGAVAWVALLVLARPVLGPSLTRVSRSAEAAAIVGVVAILAISAWNAAHTSQHVLIDRDGGAYANEGRWFARSGDLSLNPRVGPFANEPALRFDSFAVYPMQNGSLQYQFAHLVPVVLAEAVAIDGDRGLFHAPVVMSGIALLAFFVLAWKLFRQPWFAVAAALTLGLLLPEVSFSRDTYSEIPSQILLFTAVWLLASERAHLQWPVALAAGLFLGALEATRIDGIVFLVGVPPLFAWLWLRNHGSTDGRRYALTRGGAFVAGLVPGFALGLVDLMRHSGGYYSALSSNVHLLETAVGASLLASILIVVCWRRIAKAARHLPQPGTAIGIGVFVGVAGFATWILRPHLQTLHGIAGGYTERLQAVEHQALDATRSYSEYSLTWMNWYLGPLTLSAAIVCSGSLVAAVLLGRARRHVAAVALLAPASLLYLWKVSNSPDHVWVTRRLLAATFPALILLALGLAAFLFSRRGNTRRVIAGRVVAVMVALVAVAYPVHTLRDVRNMSEQRGFIYVIDDVCRTMGPDAAVVVLERDNRDLIDDWTPQTLRGWCGADVAVMRGTPDPAVIARLARAWGAEGRNFYVAASSPEPIQIAAPTATVVTTRQVTNPHLLERTLTHRPGAYLPETFQMAVARVPTN